MTIKKNYEARSAGAEYDDLFGSAFQYLSVQKNQKCLRWLLPRLHGSFIFPGCLKLCTENSTITIPFFCTKDLTAAEKYYEQKRRCSES